MLRRASAGRKVLRAEGAGPDITYFFDREKIPGPEEPGELPPPSFASPPSIKTVQWGVASVPCPIVFGNEPNGKQKGGTV